MPGEGWIEFGAAEIGGDHRKALHEVHDVLMLERRKRRIPEGFAAAACSAGAGDLGLQAERRARATTPEKIEVPHVRYPRVEEVIAAIVPAGTGKARVSPRTSNAVSRSICTPERSDDRHARQRRRESASTL